MTPYRNAPAGTAPPTVSSDALDREVRVDPAQIPEVIRNHHRSFSPRLAIWVKQRSYRPRMRRKWLRFDGDLLLIRTHQYGEESLWAIDIARGVTRQVLPGEQVTFRRTRGGNAVRDLDGAAPERVIQLTELRP